MPYRSNRAAVLQAFRQDAADRVNRATQAHFDTVDREVPRDTERLAESLRAGDDATPSNPTRMITIGQEEVRGVFVDYEVIVNDGRVGKDGGFVPGEHFWEEGEEAGRREMARR